MTTNWVGFLLGAFAVAGGCAQGTTDEVSGPATAATSTDAGVGTAAADSGSGDQAPIGNDSGSIGASSDSGSTVGVLDTGTSADANGGAGDDAGVDSGVDPNVPSDDAGTDGSIAATIPTTCAEAYQQTGCCVGSVLYYCNSGPVSKKTCTGTQVCGWSGSKSWYDCVGAPGGPDPSGTHPMACK